MRPTSDTDIDIYNTETALNIKYPEVDPNARECESIGMGGNCGVHCPIFLRGECWNVTHDRQYDSFIYQMVALKPTKTQLEVICLLYPDVKEFREITEERFGNVE